MSKSETKRGRHAERDATDGSTASSRLVRVSMALEEDLLARFDALVEEKQYRTRSEALRDLMRATLVEKQWADNREVVGTVTLLYDHHIREVGPSLTRMQHESAAHVLSSLHVHLDRRLCLEVIVVQGEARDVRALADGLIGIRGVLHGQLTASSAGQDLAGDEELHEH